MQFHHSKNKKHLLVSTLTYGFTSKLQESTTVEEIIRNLILYAKFHIDIYSDHLSEQDSMIGLRINMYCYPMYWKIPEIEKEKDRFKVRELNDKYFDQLPQEIKDLKAASEPFERADYETVGGYTKAWNNLVAAINTAYENLIDNEDKKQYQQLVEQVGETIRDWGEDE